MYTNNNKMPLKICLVGSQRSGKTRFAQSLGISRDEDFFYKDEYQSTLGVNLDLVTFQGTLIDLWDIGSIYLGEGKAYTNGAHGILLFHDTENAPPPFSIPQGIPVIDVFPNQNDENPMGNLLNLINAN